MSTGTPSSTAQKLRKLPEPEPSAGREAYHLERELALQASPERRANYEKYRSSCRRLAEVNYSPTVLDIENVSRCNFRCTMCAASDYVRGKRAEDMPFSQFQRLLDEQYGLIEIKLHGIGEPLLQGEPFFEMIRLARARHLWVRTVTNGSVLHVRDNYRRLVDSGVNEVQISIDGADKETFESIRRGGRFDKVRDNCKLINAYCLSVGVRITKMWTMVQRRNYQQLEQLVDLAAEVGFRDQVFSLQMHDFASESWRKRNEPENVEQDLNYDRLLALIERGESKGVKVRFWNISDKYRTTSPQELCPWPFERAMITSDLRTVPCCMVSSPDAFELGKGKPFSEVWWSEEYTDFRRAHLEGNIPPICRGCYE